MEKKKWFNNGLQEIQISDGSLVPEGFKKGRLPKPKEIDKLISIVSKEDLFRFYILENNSFQDTFEHYNITRRHLRQLLNYYDISKGKHQKAAFKITRSHENYVAGGKKSAETQKQNWKEKSDEEREQWSQKQSAAHKTEKYRKIKSEQNTQYWQSLSKEERERQNKLRSETGKKTWSNPELKAYQQQRMSEERAKRTGNRFRTIAEEKIYNRLLADYPDVKYEYYDERYPYNCDFYIRSLDLFIEYQGYPSHGTRPYDVNDPKSVEESYKMYGEWLVNYTQTDVKKHETAKNNNLNFIRIYPRSSFEENLMFNNNQFSNIIKTILDS